MLERKPREEPIDHGKKIVSSSLMTFHGSHFSGTRSSCKSVVQICQAKLNFTPDTASHRATLPFNHPS